MRSAPHLSSPEQEPDPLGEITGLGYEYGSYLALRDVSFDVYRGEIVVLVGRNGAGKSMLPRAVAGWSGLADGVVRVLGVSAQRDERRLREHAVLRLAPCSGRGDGSFREASASGWPPSTTTPETPRCSTASTLHTSLLPSSAGWRSGGPSLPAQQSSSPVACRSAFARPSPYGALLIVAAVAGGPGALLGTALALTVILGLVGSKAIIG